MPYRDYLVALSCRRAALRQQLEQLQGRIRELRQLEQQATKIRSELAVIGHQLRQASTGTPPQRARWPAAVALSLTAALLAASLTQPPTTRCRWPEEARLRAHEVRQAAMVWRVLAGMRGECPSANALVADGTLASDGHRNDPWGAPYLIVCTPDDVTVVSRGRDQRLGTADDIVVGPRVGLR